MKTKTKAKTRVQPAIHQRGELEARIATLKVGKSLEFSGVSSGSLLRSANAAAARVSPREYRIRKTPTGYRVIRFPDRVV